MRPQPNVVINRPISDKERARIIADVTASHDRMMQAARDIKWEKVDGKWVKL